MDTLTERPPLELEREVLAWTEAVYDEAELELSESHEIKITAKIIDYICSRQWSKKVRGGRSRPIINKTFRHFMEMVGLLTDLELKFDVKFTDTVEGHSELEFLLNRMITDWAFDTDFEMELSMAVMYGIIHTGPVKIQWNSELLDGLGDNEFQVLSPLNYMRIGDGNKIENSEVIIYRRPVTVQYLQRRYGSLADGITPDIMSSQMPSTSLRPPGVANSTWNRLSPALRNLMGIRKQGTQSRFPQTMLKEYWLKDSSVWHGKESIVVGNPLANWAYIVEPGMALYPRGRVIITAGNKVLEDSCNPYWHGRPPFAEYRAFQVPWNFKHGASVMEPLVAMQYVLNRINGGVMDTVLSAITPGVMGPKGAFSQQEWDTLDPSELGGKFAYNNNAARPPELTKSRELPAYVETFEQRVEREMDQTSGASAISQAMSKKQVPGGDSLDMIFSSRSIPMRFMSRGLKTFLNQCGRMVTANLLQFATAERRVAKYGASGIVANDLVPYYKSFLPKGMEPEEFVRKANFTIRRGSLLSIEKSEKIQFAFALRKQHDLSRHMLLEFLDANIDIQKNDEQLKQEMAEKAAIAQAAGALGAAHKKH